MNSCTSRHHWLMPWLGPVALGLAYLLELVREGLGGDPLGMLFQIALAVPLVIALSVLLAVTEQELRAHALTRRLRHWLTWTPRVLLVLFIAFLALLSRDVFDEGGPRDVALGLLMHNLPALALLATAIAAWRWPWIAALGPFAFAAWWLSFFSAGGFVPSVVLLMAALPLSVAALFVLSWLFGEPSSHAPGASQRRLVSGS